MYTGKHDQLCHSRWLHQKIPNMDSWGTYRCSWKISSTKYLYQFLCFHENPLADPGRYLLWTHNFELYWIWRNPLPLEFKPTSIRTIVHCLISLITSQVISHINNSPMNIAEAYNLPGSITLLEYNGLQQALGKQPLLFRSCNVSLINKNMCDIFYST